MTQPLLLDLYSKAGGAAMGYHRAGFRVIGVDIEPQPRYPFDFIQGDALTVGAELLATLPVAAVHASPPCQRHTKSTKRWGAEVVNGHPDLVEPTRALLNATGLPYVMENTEGAPLVDPVKLCGSMFPETRRLRRHRLFECHGFRPPQPPCAHAGQGYVVGVYGHSGGRSVRDGLSFGTAPVWRAAMGIDWMTRDELAQAIPPTYTEWIGQHLMDAVRSVRLRG
jgi:DNA (cytosine-5)-methyltransferase 1